MKIDMPNIVMKSFGIEKWEKISPQKHNNPRDYYISSHGRVVSKDKISGNEFLLKPSRNKKTGYYTAFVVAESNKRKQYYIHKLVAKYFGLKASSDDEVFISFKDGDKSNFQLGNLKYITQEELYNKSLKKYRNSTPISEKRTNSKLNISQVKRLKNQLKRGKVRKAKLARMYNVSETQIARIERGENWAHVQV